MSKRELGFSSVPVDPEGPASKRVKDESPGGQDHDVSMSDPVTAEETGNFGGANLKRDDTVKEQGLQLWNVIKNATSKECVTMHCLFQLPLQPPTNLLSAHMLFVIFSEAVSSQMISCVGHPNDSTRIIINSFSVPSLSTT